MRLTGERVAWWVWTSSPINFRRSLIPYIVAFARSRLITLGGNPAEKDFWSPVIEICQKKLAIWKANFLSLVVELHSIKAALSNLPIYYLSIFKIPIGIARQIETLQRKFLWRGSSDSKPHLIKWDIVRRPKDHGGLGIGAIQQKNQALLGKWLWRFYREQISLWASIIRSKVGHGLDGWSSRHFHPSPLRSPWKGISSIFHPYIPLIHHGLGNGSSIRFWLDSGPLVALSGIYFQLYSTYPPRKML